MAIVPPCETQRLVGACGLSKDGHRFSSDDFQRCIFAIRTHIAAWGGIILGVLMAKEWTGDKDHWNKDTALMKAVKTYNNQDRIFFSSIWDKHMEKLKLTWVHGAPWYVPSWDLYLQSRCNAQAQQYFSPQHDTSVNPKLTWWSALKQGSKRSS